MLLARFPLRRQKFNSNSDDVGFVVDQSEQRRVFSGTSVSRANYHCSSDGACGPQIGSVVKQEITISQAAPCAAAVRLSSTAVGYVRQFQLPGVQTRNVRKREAGACRGFPFRSVPDPDEGHK
jgi:hypothetical protein